jgi:hypothetical protein
MSAITLALAKKPLGAEFNIRAAQIAEAYGNFKYALSCAALAASIAPKHPHILATLSRLLFLNSQKIQALHYTDVALSIAPESRLFTEQRRGILN